MPLLVSCHRKTSLYTLLVFTDDSTGWAVIVFDISVAKESIFPMPSNR